jgi:uncharacterized delta-60 repeat protein
VNQAPVLTSGGGNGAVTTDFGSFSAQVRSVTVQADGKIVVAGYAQDIQGQGGYNSELVRYNADGSIDPTFGIGGIVSSGPGFATGSGVAIQADGKIVTAGAVFGSPNHFALARYNSDGSFDASFGTGGKVATDFGTTVPFGLLIQPDGKIVLAGGADGSLDFGVARFNSDGSFDTSFDTDGKVTTNFGGTYAAGYGVARTPDGKIVVAGVKEFVGTGFDYDFAVARYNNDGSLDSSFGAGGKVTTDFASTDDIPYGVTVQADGKIVASGITDPGGAANFGLVRYNVDGSLDASFGTGGKVVTDFGANIEANNSVTMQADGKIVVAGFTFVGTFNADFALARYNTDGSLDTSFGTGGKVTTGFGLNNEVAISVVVQPDGKIVVAGSTSAGPGTGADYELARYNSDGSLDTSFGTAAALAGATFFTEGGSPAVLNAGATVHDIELAAAGSYAGAALTLARHGGGNAQDVFGASGNLAALTQGGNIVLSGVTIGAVTHNSAGALLLTFGANATEARVNEAMRDITYTNTSDTPAASVLIDWSFSDGNSGAQGTGGALAAAGTTAVNITAVDDAPVNTVPGPLSAPSGTDFAIAGLSVSDPDSSSLKTILSVDHGTLTVAAVGGVTVSGSGTRSVTLTGSDAQIDAALGASHNVVYHSTPGFAGADQLTMASFDGAFTANGAAVADFDAVPINVTPHQFVFAQPTFQLAAFAPGAAGWDSNDHYPRELADVNHDGMADIVGFGEAGVYESLATGGGGFGPLSFQLQAFGNSSGGWSSQDKYPRELADINHDGMADIVGFGEAGVYVSLAAGGGSFGPLSFQLQAFGNSSGGWSSEDKYPRELADVNGDGMADIVGFGEAGVYVSLATGGGTFGPLALKLEAFGNSSGGWDSQDHYPRHLADLNGDGMADIVGFGEAGVYVALASGDGNFGPLALKLAAFGPGTSGWVSNDQFPRELADVNGDGKVDIVGFGQNNVFVAFGNGDGSFQPIVADVHDFTAGAGWTSEDHNPRLLADVNHDGAADIVGFGQSGVYEALSNGFHLI